MQEFDKAIFFYDKARIIREEILPENHPSLATTYSNLGVAFLSLGKYEKVEEMFKKAKKIRKISLPYDHPDLIQAYKNLKDFYNFRSNPEKYQKYEKNLNAI